MTWMSGDLSVRTRSATHSKTVDKLLFLAGVGFLIGTTGSIGGMAQSFLLDGKHSIRASVTWPCGF